MVGQPSVGSSAFLSHAEGQVLEDVLFPEPLIFSPNKKARAAEAVATVVTTAAAARIERSAEVQHGVDAALAKLELEAMPTGLDQLQAAADAAFQAAESHTAADPEKAAAVKLEIIAAQKLLRRQLLTRASRPNRALLL